MVVHPTIISQCCVVVVGRPKKQNNAGNNNNKTLRWPMLLVMAWSLIVSSIILCCAPTHQVLAFQQQQPVTPLVSSSSSSSLSSSQHIRWHGWSSTSSSPHQSLPQQRRPRQRPQTRSSTSLRMALPVLKEWKVLPNGRLEGIIANQQHPQWPEGSVISTSPLKNNPDEAVATGREVILVETLSGSQYLLLNPPVAAGAYASGNATGNNNNNNNNAAPSISTSTAVGVPVPRTTGYENDGIQLNNAGETVISRMPVGSDDNNNNNNNNQGTNNNNNKTKRLMQQVKDAGIAGVISYALWELGFWTVSVPVCIVAYKEVTGHWPDFSNSEDLQKLGAEAFAFVNVARLAVPIRIGLALSTTPWIETNIVNQFISKPQSSSSSSSSASYNQSKEDQ